MLLLLARQTECKGEKKTLKNYFINKNESNRRDNEPTNNPV